MRVLQALELAPVLAQVRARVQAQAQLRYCQTALRTASHAGTPATGSGARPLEVFVRSHDLLSALTRHFCPPCHVTRSAPLFEMCFLPSPVPCPLLLAVSPMILQYYICCEWLWLSARRSVQEAASGPADASAIVPLHSSRKVAYALGLLKGLRTEGLCSASPGGGFGGRAGCGRCRCRESLE